MLLLFFGQTAVYLEALRKATSLAQWSDAAHSLMGSARAVGANRIAEAATQAEALRALKPDNIRELCLQEIEAAIGEADRYMGSLP